MVNLTIAEWLKYYGHDVQAYFSIYQGACQRCIKLYSTAGVGSEPILFLLKDLVNEKVVEGELIEDLYPSGGTCDLCCSRTLTVKPPNSTWNPALKQYVLVRNTYGVNRKSTLTVRIRKKL